VALCGPKCLGESGRDVPQPPNIHLFGLQTHCEGVESSTVRQPTEAEFFLWYFCSAYNERGDQRMTRLARVRTRRELLRATASISFLGLARRFASADPGNVDNQGNHYGWYKDGKPSPNGGSCFLRGTKILTPSGDRPVEDLRIGDEAETLVGCKTIKWIGYNKFTKQESRAWPDSVMPVRVARFAIDDCTPRHNLYLSPLHCLFVNGALIPVMYLVNESSIAPGTPSEMSALEYYHIEFDSHEVIYAEGALVESYDGEDRDNFANFIQYERLYGVERQSKTPPAPILRYHGRRAELSAVARSLISEVVDVRDAIQIAYDQLSQRVGIS
jgi:hypothetical protein